MYVDVQELTAVQSTTRGAALVLSAVAVLVGVLLPLAAAWRAKASGNAMVWNRPAKIAVYWGNSLSLWMLALLVAGAGWWAGRSPAEWGLRGVVTGSWPWALGLSTILFAAWLLDVWNRVRTAERRRDSLARWRRQLPFAPASGNEFAHYTVVAVSAGLCEEWIYRGFLVSWVLSLGAPVWMSIALPAIAFGAAHLYQDRSGALKVMGLAIGFGALFVATGSLLPGMIVHTVIDLLGGGLAWKVGEAERSEITADG